MRNVFTGTIIWFIATLFVIYAFSLNTAASVFQDAVRFSLHATNEAVSLAMVAFIAGYACMQIPAGYLLDQFNIKYVVSFGILLLTIGNFLAASSQDLIFFALSNLIQGMGGAFGFVSAALLISQWFTQKNFPIFFGLTQSISCIMAGIIHWFMAKMISVLSWNSMYCYLGIFGFILFLLSLCFIQSPPLRLPPKSISLKDALVTVFKNKQIMLCTLCVSTSFGILLAYASFWYMSIQKFYHVPTSEIWIISSYLFVGIGVGTPLLGIISNRFHSRILIIHISLILGTMMLLAGIYLPHFSTYSFLPIKIISFLIGLLLSGSMLFFTIVSEIASDNIRGIAFSVNNTGVFLVNALMMFIPYFFITQSSKIFFTYLWIMPFCILISILFLYFIKESYPTNHP